MRKGFTLIELVIALSLSAIVFMVGSYFVLDLVKRYDRLSREAGASQIRQMVIIRITKDIRSADAVISILPDRISLRSGTETISYALTGQKVKRSAGASSAYLSDTGEIKKLGFSSPKKALIVFEVDSDRTGAFCRNEK